jgi:hypothetical protein
MFESALEIEIQMSFTFVEPNTVHNSDDLQSEHILPKVVTIFEDDGIQGLNRVTKRIRIFPD